MILLLELVVNLVNKQFQNNLLLSSVGDRLQVSVKFFWMIN